jgi:hypothetical protein
MICEQTRASRTNLYEAAIEAIQERLFELGLSIVEAARLIDLLKREILLASSF